MALIKYAIYGFLSGAIGGTGFLLGMDVFAHLLISIFKDMPPMEIGGQVSGDTLTLEQLSLICGFIGFGVSTFWYSCGCFKNKPRRAA